MLGMLFDVFLFISMHISLAHFPQVLHKQTLGEVVRWPVIWWPVLPEIFVPKIIKISKPVFQWKSIMFRMFFSRHSVDITFCHSSLDVPSCHYTWLHLRTITKSAGNSSSSSTSHPPPSCSPPGSMSSSPAIVKPPSEHHHNKYHSPSTEVKKLMQRRSFNQGFHSFTDQKNPGLFQDPREKFSRTFL